MVFEGLSTSAALGLFAGGVATLVVLHLLRTRAREQRVVTTIFWREAQAMRQPRHLLQRFANPLAFVLLACIVAFVCLALSSAIRQTGAAKRRYVALVLDAGMSMQAKANADAPRRFAEARRAAEATLAGLSGDDRVCVIAADPLPHVIHRFDQPVAGAREALDQIVPADQPAQRDAALQLAGSLLAERDNPDIVLVTDQAVPIAETNPADIPIEVIAIGDAVDNAAILSAVFVGNDATGERGNVHVRIGAWGKAGSNIHVTATLTATSDKIIDTDVTIAPGTAIDLVSTPVVADGGVAKIALNERSGTPADNHASVTLARAMPLVVSASGDVPIALRLGLEALGCTFVESRDANADIDLLTLPANARSNNKPAIIINSDGREVPANAPLLAMAAPDAWRGADVRGCFCGPGSAIPLSQDGATRVPLLIADGDLAVAAIERANAHAPRMLLSDALFAHEATFANQPAFIVALGGMLEALKVRQPAGAALPADRALRDPVWLEHVATREPVDLIHGDRVASNLQNVPEHSTEQSATSTAATWRLDYVLLAAALLLVIVEGLLHARGRIV